MKNQKAINDMEALIIDNPRLGATKPEMANGEKEVRKYSSGSTNCIEESVLNVKAADTCIPIRDRTHQEITDLPDFFLKSNANTVPLNALNVSDTIHAVEKGLRTKTFLLEGTRTVSMVIDDYEIKSNGTTPASGSIKCIFTQGSSSKEQEKKPTPRENPKTFNEEHGKGIIKRYFSKGIFTKFKLLESVENKCRYILISDNYIYINCLPILIITEYFKW